MTSSILSEIYENRESIYKGRDIYFSLFVTVVVSVCLFLNVVSNHDILIVLNNLVITIQPLINTLFPIMIGALATIVAFLFAGLIFLISFDKRDEFVLSLAQDNQISYRMVLFHIRWAASIGVFGIITTLCTIFSLFIGCSIITLVLFMVSVFFFVYTISSVFGLFSLLAYYGKKRLKYHSENKP